uniref:Uncharacterized protein n=1 Tax=Photinus pyralis TaxID=7054 RepID=A0A1Y1L245_PHOPY
MSIDKFGKHILNQSKAEEVSSYTYESYLYLLGTHAENTPFIRWHTSSRTPQAFAFPLTECVVIKSSWSPRHGTTIIINERLYNTPLKLIGITLRKGDIIKAKCPKYNAGQLFCLELLLQSRLRK